MNVTEASLKSVDRHWAVLAVGEEERDRGLAIADARLVRKAVGQQIHIELSEQDTDADLLRRLAIAYELAAVEGLSALCNTGADSAELREQCAAGASRAFELRRLFDIPHGITDRISHVLHLSALAYCGDRWSDLRRWYTENDGAIEVPSVAGANWSFRLLYRLFECWVRLFRKKRWDDLDRVREIIAGLREDQSKYEAGVIDTGRPLEDRTAAIQLIALYHGAKATELLAEYMLQGEPAAIVPLLDKHFEAAIRASAAASDAQLEVMLRWLYAASRQMVSGSVWWVARAVNSRVSRFTREITKQQALFELLPPQRAALQEQGLLDQAATAIVIDMPTSGGKTLLAQFRILQALNQFDAENGWVAYVAPTRALTSQLARRFRRDFAPIGIRVEHLTGAVEIDAFEDDLLTQSEVDEQFQVLISTPEKLQIVIRNNKVPRPLALIVMDEAHNIADKSRGLRMELLLATVKQDCPTANFLLLMPYVAHSENIARWLANDINAGKTISFGTSPWRPNERIVGMYWVESDTTARGGWQLVYQTLTTSPKTIKLEGLHHVGGRRPLDLPWSKLESNLGLQSAAMARVLSDRGGTSIAVGRTIASVWSMAREVAGALPALSPIPDDVRLVQEFLAAEIGEDFELVEMLGRGVAVHHAGLSDEARALLEWLCENGQLKVLCATSTIAQGINFPVSSVFLASRSIPARNHSFEMPPRDFWNLAGRAGRMNHDSVGVVGIAAGDDPSGVIEFVSRSTGALVSNLVRLLDQIEEAGQLNQLDTIILSPEWDDFRCYIAHLWSQKTNLEAVLADAEQVLRNTYGYGLLRSTEKGKTKAERLLEATKSYARRLANSPGHAELADTTGFSPEGVRRALAGLGDLQKQLTPNDWLPESLFGTGSGIADLFGVMLRIPQLADSLEDLTGPGLGNKYIAEVTMAWVNGSSIQEIARSYFDSGGDRTKATSDACRAIYRSIVHAGTWGISALSQLSGMDFGSLSAAEQRQINALPAMIYHGVKSENAVLMRMNNAPRSVSEALGEAFAEATSSDEGRRSVDQARSFLRQMSVSDWDRVRPPTSPLSGAGYRRVWSLLSGEVGH